MSNKSNRKMDKTEWSDERKEIQRKYNSKHYAKKKEEGTLLEYCEYCDKNYYRGGGMTRHKKSIKHRFNEMTANNK